MSFLLELTVNLKYQVTLGSGLAEILQVNTAFEVFGTTTLSIGLSKTGAVPFKNYAITIKL